MTLKTRLARIEQQQQRLETYLNMLTPAEWLMLLKTDATQGIQQHGLAHVVDTLDAQGMHADWVNFFTDGDMRPAAIAAMADACALPEGETYPWAWSRLSEGDLRLP